MKFFFTLFLSTFVLYAQANFNLTTEVKLAHQELFQLKLNSSKNYINQLKSKDPNNSFVLYLQSMTMFLEIFVTENKTLYEKYLDALQENIDQLEKSTSKSPWKNYCLTEMHLTEAALHGKFDHNFKAARSAFNGLGTMKKNLNEYPQFAPAWLHEGIFDVFFGSLPDQYKMIASIFGYSGNIAEGNKLMKKSWEKSLIQNTFLQDKNAFIFTYVNSQLEIEGAKNLKDLQINYSQNNLLIYCQQKFLLVENKNKEILEMLEKRPRGKEYINFYYLDYLEAKIRLMDLDPKAPKMFLEYIAHYPGDNYIKSSYQYLAWYYFMSDDLSKSNTYKTLVFKKGSDHYGADQMAEFEAGRDFNKHLIQAHFYFDQGEYKNALDVLEVVDVSKNKIDAIEKYYRLGRIYQVQNQHDLAIENYNKVLELKDFEIYYSASAALNLAKVYHAKRQLQEAKKSYKLVLSMNNFPFIDGVHQQAKVGLEHLKTQ